MAKQYTPNDGDVRWQYVVKRMHDGATRTHAEQEYTRWLAAHDARVARDAARGALSCYVDELVDANEADDLERFRDQNYPRGGPVTADEFNADHPIGTPVKENLNDQPIVLHYGR